MISDKKIILLDEYAGMNHKSLHQCQTCNHTWRTSPSAIKNGGFGCPSCYQHRVRKPLSQVKDELYAFGWNIVDDSSYQNSYQPILLEHNCGQKYQTNIDRVLRRKKRCTLCDPPPQRKAWSSPVSTGNRSYSSQIEMQCCEYLIQKFGIDDVILQKPYSPSSKQTADAYIISLDMYVEVSTINKEFYLNRILKKRKQVQNFIFVSSLDQLKSFFS